MLDPLEGPSMSAAFFDTLGLIICGSNPLSKKTEVHIFDTKINYWKKISLEGQQFETPSSFVGLHIFSFQTN